LRILDPLVFSSVWAAFVAATLMLAAASILGATLPAAAPLLGFAGTLVVYNVDRLRDLERDREPSPARSAFVGRHRAALIALCTGAALAAAACALVLPPAVLAPCAAALGLGLAHRRLKRSLPLKTLYVGASWLAVVVGIPLVLGPERPQAACGVALVLGAAIAANLVGSAARETPRVDPRRRRLRAGLAVGLCLAGAVVALLEPHAALRPLAAVPALEALALVPLAARRAPADSERHGLVFLDGALSLGALIALASAAAPIAGAR